MAVEVVLPQLGESVVEGTVTKWLVKEGDAVAKEQPLVEIATDKADTEIPSPADGVVAKIVAPVGATVPVKSVLCVIEPGAVRRAGVPTTAASAQAAASSDGPARSSSPPPSGLSTPSGRPASSGAGDSRAPARSAFGGALASPDTRRVAREHGVDVSQVPGTGEHGRVTREDVLRAAQGSLPPPPSSQSIQASPSQATRERKPVQYPAASSPPASQGGNAAEVQALLDAAIADGKQVYVPPIPNVGFGAFKVPPYVEKPGDQIIPFSRRRRITAAHMVYSKQTSPQVVTVAEVDLHNTVRLRDAHKDRYKKQGVGLTYLAFVVHATALALKENPTLNARILSDAYVLLRDINVGVAVDTKDGLVVPVIKRADGMNIRGIAQAIDEAAGKARDGKLSPDDLSGATFSVSNPGLKGNLFGGAIINQPNVGILRIGELKKRVVVVESGGVDSIAIHPVMFMALTYDHRIVDGVVANTFLWRIRELLEKGEFEV